MRGDDLSISRESFDALIRKEESKETWLVTADKHNRDEIERLKKEIAKRDRKIRLLAKKIREHASQNTIQDIRNKLKVAK